MFSYLDPKGVIVLLNTGSGYKYLSLLNGENAPKIVRNR